MRLVIVLRGVVLGAVSVDEGERAPGFGHGAFRVLSRVASKFDEKEFRRGVVCFRWGQPDGRSEGKHEGKQRRESP